MTVVLMADTGTGRVALYDEASGGGDPQNPNSARNAPLNSPLSHLDKIYFHSDFDYMEVSLLTTVVINHAGYPAASPPAFNGGGQTGSGGGGYGSGNSGFSSNTGFAVGSYTANHLLATHGLGYIPRFKVAVNGQMLPPGFPVQTNANGAVRMVSAYATTTQIRLREFGNAGSGAMPAQSSTYTVMVFGAQPSPSNNRLIDFNPSTGVLELGLGRWRSDRRYLQVVPGGSPFGLLMGRNVDLANGAARAVLPNGGLVQNVSPTLRLYLMGQGAGTPMQYTGSFTTAPAIQVQAP